MGAVALTTTAPVVITGLTTAQTAQTAHTMVAAAVTTAHQCKAIAPLYLPARARILVAPLAVVHHPQLQVDLVAAEAAVDSAPAGNSVKHVG